MRWLIWALIKICKCKKFTKEMFSTYLRVASSWQKCSVSFLLFFQNQAECQQGFGPEVLQPLRLRWIGKLSPSPLKGFWAMRYRNFLFFFTHINGNRYQRRHSWNHLSSPQLAPQICLFQTASPWKWHPHAPSSSPPWLELYTSLYQHDRKTCQTSFGRRKENYPSVDSL